MEPTVFDFALFDRVNTSDPEEKCFFFTKKQFLSFVVCIYGSLLCTLY